MLRLGLCCIFKNEPIKFRTTTVRHILTLSGSEQKKKLSAICMHNADSLYRAYEYCLAGGIGSFRVFSQILPLKTHPKMGYSVEELPDGEEIVARFRQCGKLLRDRGLRASMHPDQFVVLSSPSPEVVHSSLSEIEYQAEVSEWIGADVVNIHGGGAYGNKAEALDRFAQNFLKLSARAQRLLTVENDDRIYSPQDLLPLCQKLKIPLVYDVHHHRCLKDSLSEKQAVNEAIKTWNREPMFHISSPLEGWNGPKPHRHHDFIDADDFPDYWKKLDVTVEVEAKAKELAVLKLKKDLQI
jgi:UV DNA damage endonuclease